MEIVFIMIAMSEVIPAQHEQHSLDSAVSLIERSVGGSCERLSILQLDKNIATARGRQDIEISLLVNIVTSHF